MWCVLVRLSTVGIDSYSMQTAIARWWVCISCLLGVAVSQAKRVGTWPLWWSCLLGVAVWQIGRFACES